MSVKKKANDKLNILTDEEKRMDLDGIEKMMTELVLGTNLDNFFLNNKKMEMLERLGNFKAKRIQIEQQQELLDQQRAMAENNGIIAQPLTVEIIDATDEDRVKKIEQQVEEQVLGGKNNA